MAYNKLVIENKTVMYLYGSDASTEDNDEKSGSLLNGIILSRVIHKILTVA